MTRNPDEMNFWDILYASIEADCNHTIHTVDGKTIIGKVKEVNTDFITLLDEISEEDCRRFFHIQIKNIVSMSERQYIKGDDKK